MYNLKQNNFVSFKIVYVEYGLKLVGQFVIFSFLIKSVSSTDFADYAFYLMVFGYISSVINSSFDALVNRDLASNKMNSEESYFHYLKTKIIFYLLFSFLFIEILSIRFSDIFFYWLLGIVGILNEHLDLKMRFVNRYSPVFFRIIAYPIFFIAKLVLAINGFILETVILSVVECLVAILINLKIIKLKVFIGEEWHFIKSNYKDILKTGTSGFLIFTFINLDQFFTYRYISKDVYAGYAILYRFYNILNSMVGIYSRYLTPKLYLNELSYIDALKRLFVTNAALSIPVYISFNLYINYWTMGYYQTLIAFPIMILGSFGLIFGQVRGVYFVKEQNLVPDIYNAIIGIAVFLTTFILVDPKSTIGISVCYLLGVITSGILTTLLYKDGISFLRNILKKDNYNG